MRKKTNHKAESGSSADRLVGGAPDSGIRSLIQQLTSPRAAERERARRELVALGAPAVPELLEAFAAADERGRLEACKALTEIAHPAAISAFIHCLEDEHQDLRWIAAEGLLNIGGPAVEPLLLALIDRASAHTILDGAVHVLRGLSRRVSEPLFAPLISAAVRAPEPGVSVPLAAETTLETWRGIWNEAASERTASISLTLEPRGDKPWYDKRQ